MLVAWDTRDGDENLTSQNYPWGRCDPVWRSGKVLNRTSRGPGFNSLMGPDFFTNSIQCVFVSQYFIIYLIDYLTGLYHLFWSLHALLERKIHISLNLVEVSSKIEQSLHWKKMGDEELSSVPLTCPNEQSSCKSHLPKQKTKQNKTKQKQRKMNKQKNKTKQQQQNPNRCKQAKKPKTKKQNINKTNKQRQKIVCLGQSARLNFTACSLVRCLYHWYKYQCDNCKGCYTNISVHQSALIDVHGAQN